MTDNFINQLTLDCLISARQLEKLNRKTKENAVINNDRQIFKERVIELFNNLYEHECDTIVEPDIKRSFNYFVDKCIQHFKTGDLNNDMLALCEDIQDDIDYDKEERAIARGDYQYHSGEEEEDGEGEDGEEEDDEEKEPDEFGKDETEDNESEDNESEDNETEDNETEDNETTVKDELKNKPVHSPIVVKRKSHRKTNSVGVDDIQKLPIDWFQNVRDNYKKNQILPRNK
jgi:cobalamin biosynthesis protein CobT